MEIEAIKKHLKEQGITYEELADRTNLSISTIKKLFSGISKYPRIDTMQAIERALGLDRPVPLTDEDKALGAQEVPLFPVTEEEQDLLELRSEIIRLKGEEFWKSLETMLKAIAKEEKGEKNMKIP